MKLKTMLRIQDQLPCVTFTVSSEEAEGEYKLLHVFCACLYEYSYFTERFIAM